ncbi:ABC transporter ATP-binding protein [Cellulomonas oligotrophica]|uniref:ABC-2 type transport system ATP-binding protein n=1 Tax=Cellulomonas oligotrophica TaxID=931536 RepID=A0A7Y9FIV4_9CELL|nr:ABC transporter ATP-binding protein [Cellulomonas oligotrophica]NYD86821.1 ABC-2 type transport system ATP-binding protein [Cellulomonas oligotrophica]GIG32394.1 multidrug ABC transporter ATP-binding protein [Cellulomonas oligotrophica]
MGTDDVLTVRGLRKRYRGRQGVQANDGIDLDVAAGQVVGLLGHNGAGKSTLVHQVVGIVRPDSGSITLDGVDAVARPDLARRAATVQAQANVPITGLTPRRAIELVGRIRRGDRAAVRRRTEELLDALDLGPWADTPAEKVSGGIARLTAFAMTAVRPGRLVVLDEPTNDVDPVRRRLLWQQIRGLADAGHGVLLVTHNVREAERVVDHLAVLDRGVVLASDTPAGLTAALRGSLTVEVDVAPGTALTWHPAVQVTSTGRLREAGTVPAARAADVVAWAQAEVEAGRLERYALTPASLEDVYVALVGDVRRADHHDPADPSRPAPQEDAA